jgi:hypothetical protein
MDMIKKTYGRIIECIILKNYHACGMGIFVQLRKYANISIAKSNIIAAKAIRFSSIIGCNHYWMTYGNFSFTFSIEHTIVVTYSCIYD